MNRDIRIGLFIIAGAAIIILGLLTGERYYMTVPAAYPLGAIGLSFWIAIEIMAPILRGITPQVISNIGHQPIRPDDIKHIPWRYRAPLTKEQKEKGEQPKTKTIDLTIMYTGSIHVDNFWTGGGRTTDPILVVPTVSIVIETLGNDEPFTYFVTSDSSQ